VQQLPHPLRGHLDVELLTDEIPHDPAGPQREIELELPRITPDQPPPQLTGLLIGQF
jgi:hypothetical protein